MPSISASFQRAWLPGTTFSGIGNYVKAFTDPSFLSGVWFVVRFSVVLIPVADGRLIGGCAGFGQSDDASGQIPPAS